MNREGLKVLDRRLSRVETTLAWLLAAAWLCAINLVDLVAWAVLVYAPVAVSHYEMIRLMHEKVSFYHSLRVTHLNRTP